MPCIIGDLQDEEEEVKTINLKNLKNKIIFFQDEEPEPPRVDLNRPRCDDYQALGYKCVQFWECDEGGNILTDSGDVTMIDVRMNNKRSRQNPGAFNPYDKICDDELMVCCKGRCQGEAGRAVKKSAGGSISAARDKNNAFCPGDFTGHCLIVDCERIKVLKLQSLRTKYF